MTRAPLARALSRSALVALCALAGLPLASPAAGQLDPSTGGLWEQDGSVVGTAAIDDRFGEALANGDFDGDGADDLAIGVPGEEVAFAGHAGRVLVLYGGESGLGGWGVESWDADDFAGLGLGANDGDRFGSAIASGDFDDDGYDDLAVGAPFAAAAGEDDAGIVLVLYGSPTGLEIAGQQAWWQGRNSLSGVPEAGDRLGGALAAGDVDGDGFADLAIGVSLEDVGEVEDAGAVNLLRGSVGGLTAAYTGERAWTKGTFGLQEEAGAHFGDALAWGDLTGDFADDLAIGIPDEDLTGAVDGGLVVVAQGVSGSGLGLAGEVLLMKGQNFVPGQAHAGERFGATLTAADLDGDGIDDLAIASPGERVPDGVGGELFEVGAVTVMRGSPAGITGSGFGTRIERGDVDEPEGLDLFGDALAAGDFDGDGAAELVIGASGAWVGGVQAAGKAYVVAGAAGSPSGAVVAFSQAASAPGHPESWDGLGASLAVGDFDGSRFPDLAAGVPFENTGELGNSGAVNTFASTGLFRDDFESGNFGPWADAVGF